MHSKTTDAPRNRRIPWTPKEPLLCREEQLLFEISRRGASPVETVLGESRVSGRRIERSTVFLIVD